MEHHVNLYESFTDVRRLPECWEAYDNYCYPHYHSAIEMVFAHDGEMETVLNGQNVLLKKNQLLVVPSYTVHRFYTPEASHVTILSLPLDYISSFRKIMGEKTFSQYVLEDHEALEEIEFYFSKLINVHLEPMQPYRTRGYIYSILGLLVEYIGMEQRSKVTEPHQLQNILSYLDDNFMNPLTLDDIANHFGYSKSRFSHIFNENVGCSITDYLGFLRARRAANLLSQEDISITDIALDSGFGSTRSFYRTFQKCFSLTPNEFRSLEKEKQTDITSKHPVTLK